MNDYIKRKDAVCVALGSKSLGNTAYSDRFEIASRLRNLPAADVVEVVRCKDCKYWEQSKIEPSFRVCTYVCGATFVREADDFCSRAEKRRKADVITIL